MNSQKQILNFLHEAEKLKSVLRHSWLSSGRRESTAEHSWRMALMAMVIHPNLKVKTDLSKALEIILVHDLVEIYAGDVPAWRFNKSKKADLESQAINKIAKLLPGFTGKAIKKHWQEFEYGQSNEAKFARAMDKLESLVQHWEGGLKYLNNKEYKFNLTYGQKECQYDPFLKKLRSQLDDMWLKIYKKNKIRKDLYA